MASNLFHVGFDIHNYEDILPSVHEYRRGNPKDDILPDEVMNLNEADIELCVWKVDEPLIMTPHLKRIEIQRCMVTGYWFTGSTRP